jgi:hypothetical protein
MKRIIALSLTLLAMAACDDSVTQPAANDAVPTVAAFEEVAAFGVTRYLESAWTTEDIGCTMPYVGGTDDAHHVMTPNGKNVKLVCKKWMENTSGETIKDAGFGCGIYTPLGGVFTTDTRFVWDEEGYATMVCAGSYEG